MKDSIIYGGINMNLKSIMLGVVVLLSLSIFAGVLFKKKMNAPTQDQNWSFNNDWGTKDKVEPKIEPKVEPKKEEEKKVEPKVEPKKKTSPRNPNCPDGTCPPRA